MSRGAWMLLLFTCCGRTETLEQLAPPLASVASARPVDAGPQPIPFRDAGRTDRDNGPLDSGVDAGLDAGIDGGVVDPRPWRPKSCRDGSTPLARAIPVVVLVVDSSGSMAEPFEQGTKAGLVKNALSRMLPVWDPLMELGSVPLPSTAGCGTTSLQALAPGRGQTAELLWWFGTGSGESPTAETLELAGAMLDSRRASNAARQVLLITDGFPNCNSALTPATCFCASPPCTPEECLDDARTTRVLATLASRGLPTWVVSLDTEDAGVRAAVERFNEAGQRAVPGISAHVGSGNELVLRLRDIGERMLRCSFVSEHAPGATGALELREDGAPLAASEWRWVDRENGEFVVTGAACERQRRSAPPTLSGTVRCN